MRAAEQLGYHPNLMARSLMTRKSKLIVLVMAQLANPFFTEMLGLFNRSFRERGYQTLLSSVDDGLTADEVIESLLQYQPEGTVMVSCSPSLALSQRCSKLNVPIVYIDRSTGLPVEDIASRVWLSDNTLGTRVAKRLLDEKRQRVAIIAGHRDEPLSELSKAFIQHIRSSGASLVQEYGGYSYEHGYEAALRLLQSSDPPDGIFCIADAMALGALDAARMTTDTDVPTELSIIGFGDIPAVSWRSNALTTVRLPVESLVAEATEMLLKQIDSPHITRQQVLLNCPLIERGTTLPRTGNP
jgi:DNA-binding LacI/PurR family transcriptional regulator